MKENSKIEGDRKIKKIVLALMMVWMTIGMLTLTDTFGEEIKQEHIYTVKKGDTPSDVLFVLWSFYKITPADIMKWNPKMGLHIIHPGQKIKYYLPQDERFQAINEKFKDFSKSLATAKQLIAAGNKDVSLQMRTFASRIKEVLVKDSKNRAKQITQLETEFQGLKTELDQDNKEMLDVLTVSMDILQGQNTTIKSTVDRLEKAIKVKKMIFRAIIAFLVVLAIGVCWLFYSRISSKKREKIAKVRIEINGDKYIYCPKVNKEGRYLSLHKIEEKILAFQYLTDLRKSVKKSFSQDPVLVKKEIKSGRLILVKKS